jgi:hypothetical protein
MDIRKAIIVLKSLSLGIPVKMGMFTYAMTDTGMVSILYDGHVSMLSELSVGAFIRLCNKLSDDEAYLISSTVVLNEVNNE